MNVLVWGTIGVANAGDVVINELMADADGADDGLEWVELYNGGGEPVDLTGWSIEAGTSAFAPRWTWAEGAIAPGEHLLVGGAGVPGASGGVELGLGNASSSSDAVRLVDADGRVIDTVVYGAPNSDAFADDRGGPAVSLAPTPPGGGSLARASDGLDTDSSGEDFVATDAPTPGAANDAPTTSVDCAPASGVVVNEVFPDPDGDDAGREWVELYNAGPRAARLGGWGLAFGTQDYDEVGFVFPPDAAIEPGAYALVAGDAVPDADYVGSFSIGNGTDTDGVRLVDCAGTAIDTVLYGEAPNADGVLDDLGLPAFPYGDPDTDQSLARVGDGVDTNTGGDWVVAALPTPGAANVAPETLGDSGDTGAPDGCHGEPAPAPAPAPRGCGWGGTSAVAPLLLGLGRRRRRRSATLGGC